MQKQIIELNDPRPIRIGGPRRFTVLGGNGCLQCESSWTTIGIRCAAKHLVDKWRCFVDLLAVPKAAILFFKNNQFAGFIETSVAP